MRPPRRDGDNQNAVERAITRPTIKPAGVKKPEYAAPTRDRTCKTQQVGSLLTVSSVYNAQVTGGEQSVVCPAHVQQAVVASQSLRVCQYMPKCRYHARQAWWTSHRIPHTRRDVMLLQMIPAWQPPRHMATSLGPWLATHANLGALGKQATLMGDHKQLHNLLLAGPLPLLSAATHGQVRSRLCHKQVGVAARTSAAVLTGSIPPPQPAVLPSGRP